jgi:hypothetical protein
MIGGLPFKALQRGHATAGTPIYALIRWHIATWIPYMPLDPWI